MQHAKDLQKLLRKIVLHINSKEKKSLLGGYTIGQIPEELIKDTHDDPEGIMLFLEGDEYSKFSSVLKELRNDITTEYLSNKELKNKLWFLVCEVYLNPDFYKVSKNLKEKIECFLNDICQPLKTYEVFLVLENLKLQKYPIQICDFLITTYSRSDLISQGIDPKYKTLDRFSDKSLMITEQSGNNNKLVIQRAREKATFNIKLLQTYLSESKILYDENLLLNLSGDVLLKYKGAHSFIEFNWSAKRVPYGLTISDKITHCLEKSNEHFEIIKNFNLKIKQTIERALFWIGKAVEEEGYDDKVIALCSAIETLLTTKSDRLKGETLAYRLVLLNSILEQSFVSPFKILWIYELRSNIIHGSGLFQTSKNEYFTMRHVARETLFNFISVIKQNNINSVFEFIKLLETSDKVDLILDWLKKSNTRSAKSIINALETSQENVKHNA